jgi:hypothetical protein
MRLINVGHKQNRYIQLISFLKSGGIRTDSLIIQSRDLNYRKFTWLASLETNMSCLFDETVALFVCQIHENS